MKNLKIVALVMMVFASASCGSDKDKTGQGLKGNQCSGDLTVCGYNVQKNPLKHTIRTPKVVGVTYSITLYNGPSNPVPNWTDVVCSSDSVCTADGSPTTVTFEGEVRVIAFDDLYYSSASNSQFSVRAVNGSNQGTELNAILN